MPQVEGEPLDFDKYPELLSYVAQPVATLSHNIQERINTEIVGPFRSGKTSITNHCVQKSGLSYLHIDVSTYSSYREFIENLPNELRWRGFVKLPTVIYLDEFTRLDRRDPHVEQLMDFVTSTSQGGHIWIVVCHEAIKLPLRNLFPGNISLSQIPNHLRPTR